MTATLNLAPTNEVALAHLRAQLDELKRADPLAPVHLLLPSARVITQLRNELGDGVNVHFLQFYGLARAVLNAAHDNRTRDIRVHEIKDTAARRLVHHLLGQMAEADELPTFGPIWQKPGFTDVILNWLREVKSQGIRPKDVATEARRTGNARDQQLAALYQGYQDFLSGQSLSDADGLLWLAAQNLAKQPGCFAQSGPLFIYGFDQFNPVQMDLLEHLTGGFEQTTLYLLWDDSRPSDSLALTRLAATKRQVEERLNPEVNTLAEMAQPKDIDHLRRCLFEQTAIAQPSVGEIRLIEAPSREQEVRTALRQVKQLLLDGVSPDLIALLAPKPGVYRRLIATVADEYTVPVAVEGLLGANPAVSALLNALSQSPDFPWRRTFDLLRSPYFDITRWLDDEQIDLLDRLTRERPVVAGEEQWSHALQPMAQPERGDDVDGNRRHRPLVATVPRAELNAIRESLFDLFRHLTPPTSATHATYVLWIQSAILGMFPDIDPGEMTGDEPETESHPSLYLIERCDGGPHARRDHDALALLLRSLRQIVSAAELIPQAGAEVDWSTFRTDLKNILPAVPVHPNRDVAQVRFDALESGRGQTPDYLFVLGLSEGEFPTPPPVDVLYAPQERESSKLPLRRYEPGADASLWWQIVSNVGRRLVLLRPWLDDSGAPWPPSPYWQAVTEAFVDLEPTRMPVAAPTALDETASVQELSTALAVTGASAVASEVPDELALGWRLAAEGAALLAQRASWDAPGIFEGVLAADDLLAELSNCYGPSHVWSASRLNRYNACPFGFYLEQILRLEPRLDPEEGLDVLQRGSLLHAILENLYRRFTQESICPTPQTETKVLALLADCCAEAFGQAPQAYGFRPGPLWQQEQAEMRRLLESHLRAECAENGEHPRFQPFVQELGFGVGPDHPAAVLTDSEGRCVRVRGLIDRIDRDAEGGLRIIDYKSGSGAHSKTDILAGRSVQTAVYALAAAQIYGEADVRESAYLHLPTRKTSGKVDTTKSDTPELLDAVATVANQTAANVRAGRFPSAPSKISQNGACSTWCSLADVCRVTRQSVSKGRKVIGE